MARARVVAGSRDHNGTLRDAPAVMEGTSTPVARRPGTRHAKHEPRSGGRCGARYRDVAREALRALGSAVLPELRDGGPHAVGDLPLFPQRGDRSEEHTSELQSRLHLVCRLLLEKKKSTIQVYV